MTDRDMKAGVGDLVLAEFMAKAKVKAPVEKIIRTDWLLTALNRERLGKNMCKRIVLLECGHETVTTNAKRAPCPGCHRMILSGEDYDAFRNSDGN